MRVTVVTPPAVEPVTLAEAQAWAKVEDDDALLSALITAATASVEEYLRRALITQTLKLTLDINWSQSLPSGYFEMPISAFYGDLPRSIALLRPPIQSITSVVTYNTNNVSATYSASNYLLDTAGQRLVLNDTATWPSPLRSAASIEITYVAGYGSAAGDVPQPIRTAILMMVQSLYDSRGTCEDAGMPAGAKRLLNQYRVMDGLRG